MSVPDVTIREAGPADLPAIFALIRDLAEYERLAHEVVGDEDLLAEHLFGERPAAHVLIGLVDGEVAGFALYFLTFSTFLTRPGIWLEDLYVRPERRGCGLGKALLGRLAAMCVARGYGRLEWNVLDWNQPARAFYAAQGAEDLAGWTRLRVTGEALRALGAAGLAEPVQE